MELDLRLLRGRALAGTIAVNAVAQFALLGNAVLLTAYLQSVLGLSPLRAALYSLVPTIVVSAVVPLAAVLAQRTARASVMTGGLLVGAVGFLGLLAVGRQSPVWLCMIPSAVLACGIVVVTTLAADHVLAVAPADRAASSSALVETSSELAGALGMAVLGSLVNVGYRLEVGHSAGHRDHGLLRSGIAEALGHVSAVAPADRSWFVVTARTGYVSGMHLAAVCAAVLLVSGALICRLSARRG